MITLKLTSIEKKTASIIKAHGTPITTQDLKTLLSVDTRTVRDIIARLRYKGVPVVSSRNGANQGYSIAKDETERMKCVAMLSGQATTMMKNINGLASADLKNWERYLHD